MPEIVSAQINGGRAFVGVKVRGSVDPFMEIQGKLKALGTRGLKQLFAELGEYWRSDILPKHFASNNWQEYNISPRSDAYRLGAKRRYGIGKGKFVANVYAGRSERMARYASDNITSTSKRVTIPVNVPSYFSQPYNPYGRQPDKVAETLQVNQRDLTLLNNFVIKRLIGLEDEYFKRAG